MTARTAPRKPAARQAPRRRTRYGRASYRGLVFGPALLAGPASWDGLGSPLGAAGLLALCTVSITLVPVLMLTLITAPHALLLGLIPQPARKWWRHHDWRTLFTRPRKHSGPPGPLLQRMVRAADRGRCVSCGITEAQVRALAVAAQQITGSRRLTGATLELDHYFPESLGGLRCFWNFYLLCPYENEIKSNAWEYDSGRRVYRGFARSASSAQAFAILARERAIRHNPAKVLARCWRAAWAM
jgi:5-methylcytosine-specific restriction endonuclease McrA